MKVLDTSFIRDLLIGDDDAAEKAKEIDETGGAATTAISVYEITELIRQIAGSHGERERLLDEFKKFLSRVEVLPFDKEAALETWKIIVGPIRSKRDLQDAMKVATATVRGCESIVTRDIENFIDQRYLKLESYKPGS